MTFSLRGVAATLWWPDAAGSYTQDDVRVDPGCGAAVVAAGRGAFQQGQPASKLALWSVLGELRAGGEATVEQRVARGLARAHEAVERLSLGWGGLVRPWATIAVAALDGDELVLAQLGDCRISRSAGGELTRLTTEHTLAVETRGSEALHVVTRALGPMAPSCVADLRRIPAVVGDRLLLGDARLHAAVSDAELEMLTAGDLGAVERALRRRVPATRDYGSATFAVVDLTDASAGPSVGASDEPPCSWLYQPGEALPPVPAAWDDHQPRGPDRAWFDDVYARVMGRRAGRD